METASFFKTQSLKSTTRRSTAAISLLILIATALGMMTACSGKEKEPEPVVPVQIVPVHNHLGLIGSLCPLQRRVQVQIFCPGEISPDL